MIRFSPKSLKRVLIACAVVAAGTVAARTAYAEEDAGWTYKYLTVSQRCLDACSRGSDCPCATQTALE